MRVCVFIFYLPGVKDKEERGSGPDPDASSGVMLGGRSFLWLGDGRTVGKLHFDPFDNILVQVRRRILFPVCLSVMYSSPVVDGC